MIKIPKKEFKSGSTTRVYTAFLGQNPLEKRVLTQKLGEITRGGRHFSPEKSRFSQKNCSFRLEKGHFPQENAPFRGEKALYVRRSCDQGNATARIRMDKTHYVGLAPA